MKVTTRSIFRSLYMSIFALAVVSCNSTPPAEMPVEIKRPLAKDLEVFWELKQNGYKGGAKSLTSFTIKNNSSKQLINNWALFFHQPRTIDQKSLAEHIKITHINGDYFKLEPTDKWTPLSSGASVTMDFLNDAWFLKEVDAPSGIYIVFRDSLGKEYAPELIENITILPLSKGDSIAVEGTTYLQLPTAASIYGDNARNKFVEEEELCPITPSPVAFERGEGTFEIKEVANVSFAAGLENEGKFLIEKFGKDFGIALNVGAKEGAAIVLSVDSTLNVKGKKEDAYQLIVSESGVQLVGSSASSVFYGIQSLRAIVPVTAYKKEGKGISLPVCEVNDAPRFDYRGMHLDVVRNFQKKETVLRLLDMMAYYKLNKFHFHICDDEGWRVEIDGLPELTEIGSRRGHTADESDRLNPAYGSGPNPSEDSHGTGYYSKADFVEILNYAKARHIEVIPELDFPGHARAAIVSMRARYNKFMAEKKPEEANQYLLNDLNDASTYKSIQLYDDNVICVCQESTYTFLEKVVDGVVAMYKDAGLTLKNVHIGGDEVPENVWEKSPKCGSLMDQDTTYEKAADLFYYFVDRFSDILEQKGITTAGWEEIGLKKVENEEEEIIPVVNEDFLSKGFRTYIWNTVWTWGAEDRGYKLANAGYKVVLSNVNNLYFDLAYSKDPTDPGYYWGGFVNTRKAWSFIPLDFYSEQILDRWNNPLPAKVKEGKDRLTAAGKKNILGIQGQLWAETVKGSELMEYYIFPKMLGLVERAWAADPNWSSIKEDAKRWVKIQDDWNYFASKVGYFELPRLSYINGGYNYRVEAPGVQIDSTGVKANVAYPGLTIRYTEDGSEPNETSASYSDTLILPVGKTYKFQSFGWNGHQSKAVEVK